jgi:hypothetical protein
MEEDREAQGRGGGGDGDAEAIRLRFLARRILDRGGGRGDDGGSLDGDGNERRLADNIEDGGWSLDEEAANDAWMEEHRNWAGDLPLHCACSRLLLAGFRPEQQRAVAGVVRMLVDEYPQALGARNREGMTPILAALASADPSGTDAMPSESLELLRDMIQLGGPTTLWGTRRVAAAAGLEPQADGVMPEGDRGDERGQVVVATALELACARCPDPDLVRALVEARLFSLCDGLLTGDWSALLPGAVAEFVTTEARYMFLALAEMLLHDTTRGVVPDETRERVRRAVRELVDLNELKGSSLATVQAVNMQVRGSAFWQLRSDVLNDGSLQEFLRGHDAFQELICGVCRMNKAGRLLRGSEPEESVAAEAATAVLSVGHHARILDSARGDPDCLFLHLRDSPNLFFQENPSPSSSSSSSSPSSSSSSSSSFAAAAAAALQWCTSMY